MKITCLKNGPYLIENEVEVLIKEDGKPDWIKTGPIALCRCGHSATKPFCDGRHKVVNFEADLVELDERV